MGYQAAVVCCEYGQRSAAVVASSRRWVVQMLRWWGWLGGAGGGDGSGWGALGLSWGRGMGGRT
ncbi:hypothetical protein [Streptomyces sp. NPDC127033]|uniref:hypothetical protein n=1 Tax=Streptomyces sp. NPDC127033 TaxID=3347110 RepID=UPI00365BA277